MQHDYRAFLQRQVAISVGIAAVLLAAISYVRLIAYFDKSLLQALIDPNVSLVVVVGVVFLLATIRPSNVARIIQIAISFATACGIAFDGAGGNLTSTVFLIAALMLASEYGLLTDRLRVWVGIPLAAYVGIFFTASYRSTGAFLASVHVLIGAGLAAYLFVAIIRTRLAQVRDRETELETKVAQRTEGLRREVNRRAKLEIELRQTADTSQRLAAERALLLHELHHRTKNDLQLIASMIRLHGEDSEGTSNLELMAAAEDRIMAIALVHEHLYSSDELSAIKFAEYLGGLVAHLRSAQSGSRISLVEDIRCNISVGIEPAIHLGLAVNELVQNARKHAFQGRSEGKISITAVDDDSDLVLCVADDGVGFEAKRQHGGGGSIGIEIVEGLVAQMEGAIVKTDAANTEWRMIIPTSALRTTAPVPSDDIDPTSDQSNLKHAET